MPTQALSLPFETKPFQTIKPPWYTGFGEIMVKIFSILTFSNLYNLKVAGREGGGLLKLNLWSLA